MKEFKQKIFKLQNEVGKISKDKTNPFFKSQYTDINSLLEQLHPYLEKYELMLTQPIKDGTVYTVINDINSDEEISSGISLPELSDPQKIGSCITYYRRYTLTSLLALQADDDDGNKASNSVNSNSDTSTSDDNKEWLNEDGENFNKAKEAIDSGNFTIADVRKKYKISKKVAELLTK